MSLIRYQRTDVPPSFADPLPFVMRPILPVALYGLKGRIEVNALVDTGASETVIPLEFWEQIDPLFREGEVGDLTAANGAVFPVKYGTVDLEIRPDKKQIRWNAKVAFTAARDEMVLGDAGFFRYFAVEFNRANLSFEVWRSGHLPPQLLTMMPSEPMNRPFRKVIE